VTVQGHVTVPSLELISKLELPHHSDNNNNNDDGMNLCVSLLTFITYLDNNNNEMRHSAT
jgi:hypothetical protein